MSSEAYNAGKERGEAQGSWVIDGNTTEEQARKLLADIRDGDSEVLDSRPYPLSGESTGESIPELSDQYGIDLSDDDEATRFDEGHDAGYWDTVINDARAIVATDDLGRFIADHVVIIDATPKFGR